MRFPEPWHLWREALRWQQFLEQTLNDSKKLCDASGCLNQLVGSFGKIPVRISRAYKQNYR